MITEKRKGGKCWWCKKKAAKGHSLCDGHMKSSRARDRSPDVKRARTERRRAAGVEPRACGACGELGHYRSTCPKV